MSFDPHERTVGGEFVDHCRAFVAPSDVASATRWAREVSPSPPSTAASSTDRGWRVTSPSGAEPDHALRERAERHAGVARAERAQRRKRAGADAHDDRVRRPPRSVAAALGTIHRGARRIVAIAVSGRATSAWLRAD